MMQPHRMLRLFLAISGALLGLQGTTALAETVERCQFPPLTKLGMLAPQDGTARFVKIEGGAISGNVPPVEMQITGCSATARYRMHFPAPICVMNGDKQLELWPVISGVNGVRRTPISIVGHENGVDLEGNPRLQMMFALSLTEWGKPIPAGNWNASFAVNFEDR